MTFRGHSRSGALGVAALAAIAVTLSGALVTARQAADHGQTLYRPGPGVTNPMVISRVDPIYTEAARLGGIQGTVRLEVLVQKDGSVGDVKIVKSVGAADLDAEAVEAARRWTFRPAFEGVHGAVDIVIMLEMDFRPSPPTATSRAGLGGDNEVGMTVLNRADLDRAGIERPGQVLIGFGAGAHASSEPGLVAPVPSDVPLPKYTASGMRAKVQGTVRVEIVVGPDGIVNRARVAQSLDQNYYGLDASALRAALDSRFSPGRFAEGPVSVFMSLDETFRLH